jgi:hypothetical protein
MRSLVLLGPIQSLLLVPVLLVLGALLHWLIVQLYQDVRQTRVLVVPIVVDVEELVLELIKTVLMEFVH